jgi:predicted nucleic acid-binding protein
MNKLKIYLETTLFNYYFDKDRDAHADTVRLFKEIASGKYDAFTSRHVIDELAKAPETKRDAMLSLILEYGLRVLEPQPKAEQLADLYVAEGVIPQKFLTDALHIAIATVYGLDMIASVNFKHIVKQRTKLATGKINALNGFRPVEIASPMEIIDNENT